MHAHVAKIRRVKYCELAQHMLGTCYIFMRCLLFVYTTDTYVRKGVHLPTTLSIKNLKSSQPTGGGKLVNLYHGLEPE